MIPALRILGPLAAVSLVTATAAAVVVAHPHPAPAAPCPVLTSAAQYAAAVEATPRDWGADSWTSAKLADGRTLWLLGDTIRPGVFLHSAYVMQSACGPMALHAAAQLIPDAGADYFWAVANFTALHPGGTTVYVTVERIHPDPTQPLGYVGSGSELVTLDVPNGGQPRYVTRSPLPTSGQGGVGIVHWGQAVVADGGWLYVYGHKLGRAAGDFGRSLWLARVPVGKLLTLGAWQYRTATGWSSDRAAAVQVGPWVQGWGSQFTMQRVGARWVAVMRPFDAIGDHVSAMSAPAPWGPWTERVLFADPAPVGVQHYAALAHGLLPSGKYLVTVAVNPGESALSNPYTYRPEWHEEILP